MDGRWGIHLIYGDIADVAVHPLAEILNHVVAAADVGERVDDFGLFECDGFTATVRKFVAFLDWEEIPAKKRIEDFAFVDEILDGNMESEFERAIRLGVDQEVDGDFFRLADECERCVGLICLLLPGECLTVMREDCVVEIEASPAVVGLVTA